MSLESEEQIFAYIQEIGRGIIDDNEAELITEEVTKKLPERVEDKQELNEMISSILTSMCHRKKNYDTLAVRLLQGMHEMRTPFLYSDVVKKIQRNQDILGNFKPLLSPEFVQFVERNRTVVDTLFKEVVESSEPFSMSVFGWRTLQRHYLIRTHEGIVERPDHLWFRISLFLHRSDWDAVRESFLNLRQGYFIHATPTLFHAGLKHSQMASCFLVGTEDSVTGIFKTIGDAAQISKWAGGIGIHISNIRGKNSYIHGTNGISNGIMPMLKVYNDTSRYIDQCFSGDTRIVTNRGVIPINEVSALTDHVLTQSGRFHRVLAKNQFWKDKLLRLEMDGRTVLVTPQHDFLVDDGTFEALEDIRFGSQFHFVRPEPCDDGKWDKEEVWCAGLIYRCATRCDDGGFAIALPAGNPMYHAMECFLDRHYRDRYHLQGSVFQVTPAETFLPARIDYDYVGKCDFPTFFLHLSFDKVVSFVKGWGELDLRRPKEAYLNYVIQRQDTHRVTKLESITTPTIVYDLVVENDPTYQTEVGLVHNGGGKRNGAFAMYIEPWHPDIFDFVSARRNIGTEDERARDLFYALWIPDLFMKQVELENGDWHLISPSQAPELSTLHGTQFEEAYWQHVSNGNYHRKIKARQLWVEILRSQIETGTPYMLYKDTCNKRSNQQHLGTIRSSNLCCEIIEYSDDKEYAVCNLGSIALPKFLSSPTQRWHHLQIYTKPGCPYCVLLKHFLHKYGFEYDEGDEIPVEYQSLHKTYPLVIMDNAYVGGFEECWQSYLCPWFDFQKFGESIGMLVRNLNRVIDLNAYPLPECRQSNMRHRPIGIGVQGLADVFFAMRLPYDSPRARQLNAHIFEAIYYYALRASMQLAVKEGTYDSYEGSPMSRGFFHFEMGDPTHEPMFSGMFNWEELRKEIGRYGIRNSLLVAPMPTASTSQILGNTESFEPLTNNLYVRRTLAGEFYVCNPFLREDLEVLGQWDDETIDHLIIKKGSIQELQVGVTLKQLYRTVWEIPQKSLIDMAADRQMFIDQSQSFNIYLNEPDMDKLTKIHFYGWKRGLKTGSYYVRSRAAISSQNVTIDPSKEEACQSCSA